MGTDQVYAAMDWLLGRQPAIERKLAAWHLPEGEAVLYDLSGSWVEGRHCELAAHGDCRDGRRGKAQVCYGLSEPEVLPPQTPACRALMCRKPA